MTDFFVFAVTRSETCFDLFSHYETVFIYNAQQGDSWLASSLYVELVFSFWKLLPRPAKQKTDSFKSLFPNIAGHIFKNA